MTQAVLRRRTAPAQQEKPPRQSASAKQGTTETKTEAATSTASGRSPTQQSTAPRSVYASAKQAVTSYIEARPHAVMYGIVGFVAAALILLVGFWPTVLLAVFAAIGALIGRYRDGDARTRQMAQRLINRIN